MIMVVWFVYCPKRRWGLNEYILVQLYAMISALGHQTSNFRVSCSDVVEIAEKVSGKKRLVVFRFLFIDARIPLELFRRIINDAPNRWKVFCVGKRATRSNQKIIVFRVSREERCLILCNCIPLLKSTWEI